MVRKSINAVLIALLVCGFAYANAPLENVQQAILVIGRGWNDVHATLQRFERKDGKWQAVGTAIPCVLGYKGMAWGLGLNPTKTGHHPQKREGDGRSPAGIFRISGAFGFAPPEQARAIHLPYTQLTAPLECVDDPKSTHYNRTVDASSTARDWKSSEHMRRIKEYKWGAFVEQNPRATPGAGSCIFLHIWDGPDHGTAGCTAFNEEALKTTLAWLRPEAHPVLIQMPREQYDSLRELWGLP